ncbi:hypothetical protein ACFQ0K_05405 [Nocardioides caeni]|uniref:Uncharacterized protein n=1 Tax=Nocardioides caeni TaxID=574700 RepID=A0A4S8NAN2_9ACTN|nr:hypothetical protein [Nocardioides caeni]THV12129.1 hypothetical protein E9934_12320 [Nocardioides caeni]
MNDQTAPQQPPTTHWVSDPTTGEYDAPAAPRPKRRRARAVAAAAAAAVVAGFSGYAVGHVTADPDPSVASQVGEDGQQGFPGGQPPSGGTGEMGTPPDGAPEATTDDTATDPGTD